MRRAAAVVLMTASGFAGLGYQIVWTQQAALWLGHESAAVLAVVAAFFGGIAAGALALGPTIDRSPRPLRWYIGCEWVIAGWSLLLAFLMAPYSAWIVTVTGAEPGPIRQWWVAFGGSFVLFAPATAAMGATLPAMERIGAQLREGGRSIAPLYAANTLGAMLGVLSAAFWLVPRYGLTMTVSLCSVLSFACGLLALAAFRDPPSTVAADPHESRRKSRAGVVLCLTGLLGIGYEVLVVRVLSEVAEDTVYTFALLLAVYLAGGTLGAELYRRWASRAPDRIALGNALISALALACLAGGASLWAAQSAKDLALRVLTPSMGAALTAETLLALMAFGPPTVVMGAVFSHWCDSANRAGISYGRALGFNTFGAALAPVVFGVLAFPMLGPKWLLVVIILAYVGLLELSSLRKPAVWIATAAVIAMAVWLPPLAFVDVPDDGKLVSYREGVMAAVSVVEDGDGVLRLRINNRQQEGTSATLRVDGRQALLPILLHPSPRRALFLGLGTGITASSAAQDPTLEVDAVELLPEVIAASPYFTRAFDEGQPNARLHLVAADARRFVRATNRRYEVIVADNFHPARSGSGALYTREHFTAVRARLAQHGIFCQWLPLHQLDLPTLRIIVRTFLTVFPDATAMLANNGLDTPVLGLIGRGDGDRFEPASVRDRLAGTAMPHPPPVFGIEDEFAVLGSFVAGPASLARFAGGGPINTDDFPIVAHLAPRITYVQDSRPRDRLLALLAELSVTPADVVGTSVDNTFAQRLAAYWAARNLFIAAGRDVRPTRDVAAMLAQVRRPLLEVLRTSPDFRPAYDPLLQMARSLSSADRDAARELLLDLAALQPARSEAPAALRLLDGQGS